MRSIFYHIILFLVLSVGAKSISVAQNLVPNPSFEDTVQCPQNGEWWFMSSWDNPNTANPDLFHECATGNYGVPSNMFGIQNARTGKGYAGISTLIDGSGWREFLQIELTSSLNAGASYCVEFYVCTSDSSTYVSNDIQLFFSNANFWGSAPIAPPYIPQFVNNPSTNPLSSLNQWQLVSGTYIATGGESHITIGNFFSDAITNTTWIGGSTWAGSYQFIDDVRVQSCSTIGVWENSEHKLVNIHPNPTSGQLYITLNKASTGVLCVRNYLGQIIQQEEFNNTQGLDISLNGPSGLYFLQIECDGKVTTKKILKE
ncbi:MAG: T9SS type A sorting domain-containing protein [Vicingaceae bacterium]|nr:T9SS type A sorting domain-containing protein [Vicingaceae bacterium]